MVWYSSKLITTLFDFVVESVGGRACACEAIYGVGSQLAVAILTKQNLLDSHQRSACVEIGWFVARGGNSCDR